MRPKKFLVTIVIPLYNESSNLVWHHEKITDYCQNNSIVAEIIYVDDGSTDNSLQVVKRLARHDSSVRYLSLSRNFGKEAATTAGLKASTGDIVLLIDADGQHPINKLGKFIKKWQEGYDVVIGIRKANSNEGLVKKYGSKLYTSMSNVVIKGNVKQGSTDFRLLDRKVVDEFNQLTERNRITRGLIDWLGFRRCYVDFISPARHSGVATYSFSKLVKLALHSFTSQSTKPLQFTGYLGSLVTVFSSLLGIFLVLQKYVFNDPLKLAISGSALLAIFLSFLVGLVLICQWLLAIYIESIHNETQNRPLYIVSEQSNSR